MESRPVVLVLTTTTTSTSKSTLCTSTLATTSTVVLFFDFDSMLQYKARTRSAPDYNHKPVGRVPVLRPFEPYWENPGSDPRYSTGW